MRPEGKTIENILNEVPLERKEAFFKLHQCIVSNLPQGFKPGISYGFIGYVVPHEIYPDGYHCKPSEPLPFAQIASQKNSINFYHMGLYADEGLKKWFLKEYPNHSSKKLDMGKSCIRFKHIHNIPYQLIAELMQKMSVDQWISLYEQQIKK